MKVHDTTDDVATNKKHLSVARRRQEDERGCSKTTFSLYFWNISKTWTAETVALLLNKTLSESFDNDVVGNEIVSDNRPVTINILELKRPTATLQNVTTSSKECLGDDDERGEETGGNHDGSPCLVAHMEFSSRHDRDEILASYQGMAVPHTHNYHYFDFSTSKTVREERIQNEMTTATTVRSCRNEDSTKEGAVSNAILEVPSPPLHLQILALSTRELEKRLLRYGLEIPASITSRKESKSTKDNGKKDTVGFNPCKTNKVWKHAAMARIWTQFVRSHRSAIVNQLGVPVSKSATEKLLEYLRSIPSPYDSLSSVNGDGIRPLTWPVSTKQRKGVQSQHYLTVRQRHPPHQDKIWNLCYDLLEETFQKLPPSQINGGNNSRPKYNALAITKNFFGSPHIDAHDQTFQHVVALGDFASYHDDGGHLCCELDANDTCTVLSRESSISCLIPRTELRINIHNRIGRMDGRMVHWVNGWKGKDRYSIVYYTTDKADYTKPVPQSVHLEWMKRCNEENP